MSTLYLLDQGASVRRASRRIVVTKNSETVIEIPIFKIERVFAYGYVQFTTQALNFLMEEGIPTAFFYQDGRLKGIIEPVKSKNIPLRLAQYRCALDEDFVLDFSRRIVKGKLKGQKRLLHRFVIHHRNIDFSEESRSLNNALKDIDRKQSKKSLLGIEGIGTAAYFNAFRKVIKGWGEFKKREKHPPRDPVNALLSYGYTVLTTEVFFATYSYGFEPYLGFYHGVRYGRPALALDIVEEFRHPVVDMIVLDLLNRAGLNMDDFYEVENGFRMKKRVIKKFFQYYERRMLRKFKDPRDGEEVTMRKVINKQLEKLRKCVMEKQQYEPFVPP